MTDNLMRLYHHSPLPLRWMAANLRGLYLNHWRYGRVTEQLVEEALDRERWSPNRWKVWQEGRLAFILYRAATQVPYYRELWSARRRKGDTASWEYLENWPVLSKETVRQNAKALIADDRNPRYMFHDHTSGTTGTPLDLWFSKETVQSAYALHEARQRRWNGVSRNDNWAILGGQAIVPANSQRPPFWVWNAPMRQLYLSANHISHKSTPAYMDALNRYGITHLVTYPSSASVLGREALKLGLSAVGVKAVITNSEPLLPNQRRVIRESLRGNVQECYGMAELAMAASECSSGALHQWPELGYLEVLSDSDESYVSRGSAGRFVSTGLLNVDMPLIRYNLGDRGKLSCEDSTCQCGRTLPTVSSIEGRTNDLLITRDGRRVYWLNPIFYGLPLHEAQIIQETLDRVRIRHVPAPDFTLATERLIADRIQARMGRIEVVLEQVDKIPRSASGKLVAVMCNIPKDGITIGSS